MSGRWRAFRDDFKAFVQRGNVLDMAVGIAVGTAFTALVRSLVDDVLMPPVGLLVGMVDFRNMFVVLREGTEPEPYLTLAAAQEAGAVTWRYGLFVNSIVNLLIVSLAVFVVVRLVMRMMPKEPEKPPAAPTTHPCPYCRLEIALEATRCPHCTSQVEAAP